MILTLALLAAQSVQDMALLNGGPDNSLPTYDPQARAATYCDQFNRANGPLGADWTTFAGTYNINGNKVDATGTFSYTDNNVANCAASASKVSVVIGDNPGTALVYVALRIGVNVGGGNFYVKVQDQTALGDYRNYGFYVNNGSNPGGYGVFGVLPIPFDYGRMDVSYDAGTDRMRMDLDQYNDGSIEQTVYSNAGASAWALSGTGHGVGTYAASGVISFDNFEVNGGCSGPPPFSLAKSGTCPGATTLSTTNGTASAPVAFLYGNAGSFTKPSGACAGITLGISNPNLGVMLNANGAGAASVSFNASAAFCGRTVQAVDVASCTASNTVVL
jgi:hypothetical protein